MSKELTEAEKVAKIARFGFDKPELPTNREAAVLGGEAS